MRSVEAEQATAEALSAFIIQLEGEFDLSERDRLTDAFAIARAASVVVVNFQRCEYIDSTVLQCLIALYKACQEREQQLILVGLQMPVRRLLEISELVRLFDIRDRLVDVGSFDGAQVRRLTIESRPIAD